MTSAVGFPWKPGTLIRTKGGLATVVPTDDNRFRFDTNRDHVDCGTTLMILSVEKVESAVLSVYDMEATVLIYALQSNGESVYIPIPEDSWSPRGNLYKWLEELP